uniref:Uncharacterized protein n=1 Tax=Phaeomonas parva TaxID=124430 RepID=A0A7S1U5G1_9STRA|mmetsp:Transcript_32257/g.102593  ORF Transcript_32257/g.102593 Transcript_32257/m.102593 type:complete len:131 (+) Transcript_32257:88-480(+)
MEAADAGARNGDAARFDEVRRALRQRLEALSAAPLHTTDGDAQLLVDSAGLEPGDLPLDAGERSWRVLESAWITPLAEAAALHSALADVTEEVGPAPTVGRRRPAQPPRVVAPKHLFSMQDLLALRCGAE